MKTKMTTKNGVEISIDGNKVEVDGLIIEFMGSTATENSEKIMINALRKIAGFQFGNRGYITTDSRAIRRLVLDALRNVGEKATI